MKDDLLICMLQTACDVAYLSPHQIAAYGSTEAAKASLGVNYLAMPDVYLDRTEDELPYFLECGHC